MFVQQPPIINCEKKKSKRERPKPKGSSLCTDAENQQLFQVLGQDRISTVAGVAQLLYAPSDSPNTWKKINVGLAALTKDYAKKHYSMCLYDILNQKIVWEQVLYKDFEAKFYEKCPHFISFEGDLCQYALNFSDFEEADKFKKILVMRRNNDSKSEEVPHLGSTVQHFLTPKKKQWENYKKADRGNPTNFQHKVHIGWDALSGLNNENRDAPMDETVRRLILEIGQDPDSMNKSDLQFATNFMNSWKSETRSRQD